MIFGLVVSSRIRASLAAATASAALLSGCGGNGVGSPGGSVATSAPAVTPTAAAGGTSIAQVTVTWPTAYAAPSARSARRREYVSNSTASISVAINGGTPTVIANPNLSPGTTATPAPFTQATTVSIAAPAGNDTFLVSDYDSKNTLLAQNTIPYTIVLDAANVVPITLNGDLANVACAPVTPFVSGTSAALTLVGPAGQVAVLPEDADKNVIVAPGIVPTLSLSAPTTQATVTSASTNVYNVNALVTGSAITLTASGQNTATGLPTATVSGTCSLTRVKALYVANQGAYGAFNPSVTIYPATASGNATPTATIKGTVTQQNEINFPVVDGAGNLFLSNVGPMPGSVYGPTSGYVSIYGPGAYGNVAPISSITGLNVPEGIALDATGTLYVLTLDRITEYPPTANGVSAPAAVSNTITGASTSLYGQYGLHVGLDGTIYTAGFNNAVAGSLLLIFAKGATGNVAPIIVQPPGSTAMTYASDSWLDVAPDSSGNFYVTTYNNNLHMVQKYAAQTASGTPPVMGTATGFTIPAGVYVDISGTTPTNSMWVADYSASSISYFSSVTTFEAGATSTLSGANTGLNNPFGVYVR